MAPRGRATGSIDEDQVKKLLRRVARDVDDGVLPSCQVALGYEGEVVVNEVFGAAGLDDRYCIFSATKPVVSAALWHFLARGDVRLEDRVADILPGFGANAKDAVTVEQTMLHTAGFPRAALDPATWNDHAARVAAMADWSPSWEPGSQWEYHPTSAHWVIAALVETLAGADFRDVVHDRVVAPMGLPRLLGLARPEQAGIRDLVQVGEPTTPEEYEAVLGFVPPAPSAKELEELEVTPDFLLRSNEPDFRAAGVPGAGGFATAAELALLYQNFLHDPAEIFDPVVRHDAVANVRNELLDPLGLIANRSHTFVIAGDDDQKAFRGMGTTVSAGTFGHAGAGGQQAWADPATGLSLGYVTNGDDQSVFRAFQRVHETGNIAGLCAPPRR